MVFIHGKEALWKDAVRLPRNKATTNGPGSGAAAPGIHVHRNWTSQSEKAATVAIVQTMLEGSLPTTLNP